jgi:hypothetical protein
LAPACSPLAFGKFAGRNEARLSSKYGFRVLDFGLS